MAYLLSPFAGEAWVRYFSYHSGRLLCRRSSISVPLPDRFASTSPASSARACTLQLLDLTLDRLGQITHQVIPIVDLHRRRRAFSPAPGIQTTAVTSDHFHSRDAGEAPQPLGKARRRSPGKQIDHSAPL